MNTERLIDFLKTGMGSAQSVSDELLRQFTNYLLVSTVLHMAVVAIIFAFLYSSLSKGVKILAEDFVSNVWAMGFRALRVGLVVGAVAYSYNSVQQVLEPLIAPHVWITKQGVEILKK